MNTNNEISTSLPSHRLLIDWTIQNKGRVLDRKSDQIIFFGKTTNIYISKRDEIKINELTLPQRISSRLIYLFGTLNFTSEMIVSKSLDNKLLNKVIKYFKELYISLLEASDLNKIISIISEFINRKQRLNEILFN